MTKYIDRDNYVARLKEAMAEAYPNNEYMHMRQGALKESVKVRMSEYIHLRYGEYERDKFQ